MAYMNPKFIKQEEQSERDQRQVQFAQQLLGLKKGTPQTSPYRRRYNDIQQGGLDATNYETRKRNDRESAYLESLRNKIQGMNGRSINVNTGDGVGQFTGNIPNVTGNSSFEKFVAAITGQESGGNYNARNRSSGAMGRYQIMPGNINGAKRGWDYEALGRDISPSQFMGNPKLQDAIARYKLQQYYKKWGPRGAAVAWYAGPGMVGRSGNKSQGAYPTINNYANSILKRMGLL